MCYCKTNAKAFPQEKATQRRTKTILKSGFLFHSKAALNLKCGSIAQGSNRATKRGGCGSLGWRFCSHSLPGSFPHLHSSGSYPWDRRNKKKCRTVHKVPVGLKAKPSAGVMNSLLAEFNKRRACGRSAVPSEAGVTAVAGIYCRGVRRDGED